MPTTANFALPYPGALDEPCDFAQDWCAFTDAAAAVQADLQAIADRIYPVQPVAKLDLTVATTITRNSIVPFNTVSINNAGYIDFDVSSSTITVTRTGRWVAVFDAFMTSTGVANSRFFCEFESTPSSLGQSQELDLGGGASVGFAANAMYNTTLVPFDVYVVMDSSALAVATLQIQRASLAVYWHADGAAP